MCHGSGTSSEGIAIREMIFILEVPLPWHFFLFYPSTHTCAPLGVGYTEKHRSRDVGALPKRGSVVSLLAPRVASPWASGTWGMPKKNNRQPRKGRNDENPILVSHREIKKDILCIVFRFIYSSVIIILEHTHIYGYFWQPGHRRCGSFRQIGTAHPGARIFSVLVVEIKATRLGFAGVIFAMLILVALYM